MVESLSHTYTSLAEMKRLMTTNGATDYSTDYDTDLSTNVIADVIANATDEVNFYCLAWYQESDLENSSFIRQLATAIACHLLTQRRGEQSNYTALYERAINFLEKITSGERQVPRIPQRDNLTPCHSNHVVDHRFKKNPIRVQGESSSGDNYSGQKLDITFGDIW